MGNAILSHDFHTDVIVVCHRPASFNRIDGIGAGALSREKEEPRGQNNQPARSNVYRHQLLSQSVVLKSGYTHLQLLKVNSIEGTCSGRCHRGKYRHQLIRFNHGEVFSSSSSGSTTHIFQLHLYLRIMKHNLLSHSSYPISRKTKT